MSRLYKVLLNGRSANGGDMAWSLPTKNADGTYTPGAWHEHTGKLEMCSAGFHLTNDPPQWWQPGCEVYEAEYEGECLSDGGDKVCVRKTRLIRHVEDTSEVRIFVEGSHEVRGQAAIALGSSSVVAWESSRVEARESSSVVARGSSSVVARESSRVEARESSRVVAWGSSRVVARDHALISTPHEAWGHPTVKVDGHALYIDQRGEKPKLYAVVRPEYMGNEPAAVEPGS